MRWDDNAAGVDLNREPHSCRGRQGDMQQELMSSPQGWAWLMPVVDTAGSSTGYSKSEVLVSNDIMPCC